MRRDWSKVNIQSATLSYKKLIDINLLCTSSSQRRSTQSPINEWHIAILLRCSTASSKGSGYRTEQMLPIVVQHYQHYQGELLRLIALQVKVATLSLPELIGFVDDVGYDVCCV